MATMMGMQSEEITCTSVDEAKRRTEAMPGCAGSMRLVRRPSRKGRLEMCALGAGGSSSVAWVAGAGGVARWLVQGTRRRKRGGSGDVGAAARVPGQALSPGYRRTDVTL
ncbi:hypothetical protein ACQJBY_023387 [Aegilops geniculata]